MWGTAVVSKSRSAPSSPSPPAAPGSGSSVRKFTPPTPKAHLRRPNHTHTSVSQQCRRRDWFRRKRDEHRRRLHGVGLRWLR
ncbi:unnamed protein product [Mesocestoides corti]|uniref:Uncharacterized protein n=1 Tax=Mesocestoides corti TaxID=53468 RepID=A0A0R3U9E2_MESCO|nr:unnamed protein product [Mesocestoides corti]